VALLAATNLAHAQVPFPDVPVGHPAKAAVSQLAKQGLVSGYPDGAFGGRRAMTRWEFALALWRVVMKVEQDLAKIRPANAHPPSSVALPLAGLFADVPTDSSQGDVLRALASRGIIQGYPDQTFAGGRPMTQGESEAALLRTVQWVERELAAFRSTSAGTPSR
jgi:hypothetical protein